MGKPVVFVIGATGSIGSAAVSSLSAHYADQVEIRAGVRNPVKAEALKKLSNVHVVKAEMGSDELESTLRGVDALYIVTPGIDKRHVPAIKTASAAKAAGVKFLLVVSLNIPHPELTHSIFGREFNQVEEHVKTLGVPFAIVRLPFFTENVFFSQETIKGHSTVYAPVSGDKRFASILASDAGKAAAKILSSPEEHSGKTYDLVSHVMSHDEIAQTFSEALGKEVKFVRSSAEETRKALLGVGRPEWHVKGIAEFYDMVEAWGASIDEQAFTDIEKITGEKPTTLKAYIESVAPAFK